jgi:thioesterase domain-containing protein
MFVKKDGFPGKYGKYFLSKEVLTEYIVSNIPILHSVGLEVSELTENKIKISAPPFDNRNHYGSAFGGSIATLGIVAGWAILTYKIKEENIPATLVIKSSNTEYLLSVKDKFYAEVTIEEPKWESLKTKFAEKNKAGMEVTAEIISEGKVCARQKSVYVCLNSK